MILVVTVRLLGKRQIGELEVSDLVCTLILSDIASTPIENQDVPISYALIPIVTIMTIEVIMSVILMKYPKLKNLISTRPSTLIENGKIDQKELSRVRISLEELICSLRQKDVTDISEVNYAILEQSGKISVVKKAKYQEPTLKDLSIKATENGIMHILISNGYINDYNMKKHSISKEWLKRDISKRGCTIKDIFLFMIDDSKNTVCITKEGKS